METAELEYRLLKDKCNMVVAELINCRKQGSVIPPTESSEGFLNLLGNSHDLRDSFIYKAPDYLSVIDHLAGDH